MKKEVYEVPEVTIIELGDAILTLVVGTSGQDGPSAGYNPTQTEFDG